MQLLDLNFTKMCATGNDFLFLNALEDSTNKTIEQNFKDRSAAARFFCHRHFGLGADGLVFVEKNPQEQIKWDFFNSDGSMAEMCGNAARCMAKYVFSKGIAEAQFNFITLAGPIEADAREVDPIVSMSIPEAHRTDLYLEYEHHRPLQIESSGQGLYYSTINTGVPHVVFEVEILSQDQQTKDIGRFIQNHDLFQPDSTNVTFYSLQSNNEINAVTFERGVADFTLSCGTGAVAAAYCFSHKASFKNKLITVNVPGGQLHVDLAEERPRLQGPAQLVGEFKAYEKES